MEPLAERQHGVEKDLRAEFGKLDDQLSWKKKVDAYFEIEENKNFWMQLFLDFKAGSMPMMMQHSLAGACGLWAITHLPDGEFFLRQDGSYEYSTRSRIFCIPSFSKEKVLIFGKVMLLADHVTLYFCLSINRSLLPTERAVRRESSMIDVMVEELSVSSKNSGVSGSSCRISFMGVDYELDDNEMKQANIRHPRIMSTRSSVFAAFDKDDLPDIIKRKIENSIRRPSKSRTCR